MDTILSILRFLGVLLQVILVFNLIILVHEYGHFLAARWRGLKVEKFQIWFGKPIWKKTINGVQYGLGSIPAGGFVALPQMAPMGGVEGSSEEGAEKLPPITPLDKIIVAFAGPLFSILLAFAFGFLVWGIGYPDRGTKTLEIGYVKSGSAGEKGGLEVKDEIFSINDYIIKSWDGMLDSVRERIIMSRGSTIKFVVTRDGKRVVVETGYDLPEKGALERSAHRSVGIGYAHDVLVGGVIENSPADLAGMKRGDWVKAVNGKEYWSREAVSELIQKNPDGEFVFGVERMGEPMTFTVKAAKPAEPADAKPMIGVVWLHPSDVRFFVHDIIIDKVTKGSPAEKAGLKKGDRIVSVKGVEYQNQSVVSKVISESDGEIAMVVERKGKQLEINVTPGVVESADGGDSPKKMIGVAWVSPNDLAVNLPKRPTPWEQVSTSATMMWRTIQAVTSSESSLGARDLSGPIGIGNLYYRLFTMPEGWKLVLWFSVLLNVNLAILNLLPFPILDGGHIMMGVFEMIFRKPINFRVLEVVQIGCALLLFGFLLFVSFFDARDLGKGDEAKPIRFDAPKESPAVPGGASLAPAAS